MAQETHDQIDITESKAGKKLKVRPRASRTEPSVQGPTTKPVAPRRDPKPGAVRPASSIADLTPDRQAEIVASRQHKTAKRKHVYRPQLPAVDETIELHSCEISLAFIRSFEPCNQYAIAIDTVARERLTNRAEFNHYLQEFDAAIEELSERVNKLYGEFEEKTAGTKTSNKTPLVVQTSLQTRRSLQLLRLFKTADDTVRMVLFLNIYNDLDDDTAKKAIYTLQNAINRCVRALRKVKINCFRRIIEVEKLQIPNTDDTSIEDIETARRLARIGKKVQPKKKPAGNTQPHRIDPSQPALLPIGADHLSDAEPAVAQKSEDGPASPKAEGSEDDLDTEDEPAGSRGLAAE